MTTDSPQRSAPSKRKVTEVPDFATWHPMTLAKFAQEAYATILDQQDEILYLRQDLKAAIHAYRREVSNDLLQ